MIIIQPIGGLCNRMRAINSARILAEKRNDKLLVVWFVNDELGCPFEELFCTPVDFEIHTIYSKWNLKKLTFQLRAKLFGSLISNEEIKKYKGNESSMDSFANSLKNFTYIATEEHFYECHSYNSFIPNETMTKRIEHKLQALGENSVGVHIRRTDNMPSIGKSSTTAFVQSMQSELNSNKDTKFYLATDDLREEEALRERFPGKIISNEERDLSRSSISGIQDALIDLFCLSNTNKIIGSYFSSFTDIAADMHQIPKIIAGEN